MLKLNPRPNNSLKAKKTYVTDLEYQKRPSSTRKRNYCISKKLDYLFITPVLLLSKLRININDIRQLYAYKNLLMRCNLSSFHEEFWKDRLFHCGSIPS